MMVSSAAGPNKNSLYPLKQGLLMQNKLIYQLSLRNCLYLLEYIFLELFTRYLCILQYLASVFK